MKCLRVTSMSSLDWVDWYNHRHMTQCYSKKMIPLLRRQLHLPLLCQLHLPLLLASGLILNLVIAGRVKASGLVQKLQSDLDRSDATMGEDIVSSVTLEGFF